MLSEYKNLFYYYRSENMIIDYQPISYRHELKHPINGLEVYYLKERLALLFSKDQYCYKNGYYNVNSLYFDTPYDKALKEKMDGEIQREKFRIRYYNQDLSFIRLEKKIKHNGLCAKRSVPLEVWQVEKILQGEIDFLLESQEPLMIEFYSKIKGELLQPSVIVSYQRCAFIYDVANARLTIDDHLKIYKNWWEFLKLEDTYISLDGAVLEVKYNEFLPDIIVMALQGIHQKTTSYSKYARCRLLDW